MLSRRRSTFSFGSSSFASSAPTPIAVHHQVELQRPAFNFLVESLPFALVITRAQLRFERFDLFPQFDLYRRAARAFQDRITEPQVSGRGEVGVKVNRLAFTGEVVEFAFFNLIGFS